MQKFNIVSNDHGHTQKCDFSVLDWKYPFLGKFGPKIQNCLFKVKYGTLTNSNMQNQMVIFTFFFWPEISFMGKFGPKILNCQLKLKFGI